MSIFTNISNSIGSFFSGILGGGGRSNTASAGNVFGSQEYINNAIRTGAQPRSGPGSAFYGTSSYVPPPTYNSRTVPQVYGGSTGAGSNQNTAPIGGGQGGYVASGGGAGSQSSQGTPINFKLSGSAAQAYAKSAGLDNLDLNGLTYEQADQAIQQKKSEQMGQNTANTSAVFNPEAISNTTKKIDNFKLSLDKITNDAWSSTSSKKDQVQNLLKSTAKDIAVDYNTPEEIAAAYASNPTLQKTLDSYAQAGGSDQMLIDAINEKGNQSTQNNMSTSDYLASVNSNIPAGWDAQTYANFKQANPGLEPTAQDTAIMQNTAVNNDINSMIPSDVTTQNEIIRVANIPKNLKDLYLGDNGIIQQKINLAMETRSAIEKKLADTETSLRDQANLYIQKNNEDLSIAKNTIEQNRVNAKNYLTGMLAKLGALQTTSAAAEGITYLDQKYQQQSAEAESKTRYANQEIQTKLQTAIHTAESSANEKILSIREDLSKDVATIQKEIMKAQQSSDKQVYNLTMKANKEMKKNIDDYTSSAQSLAEQWAQGFAKLVSPDFGGTGLMSPSEVAGKVNVKLGVADKRLSDSARIKDPSAINYFKTLPKEVQTNWLNYVATLPPSQYFTLADLQQAYPQTIINDLTKKKTTTKSSSATSLSDITI